MKILHTADWHLGHTFYDYDRVKEHKAFLLWLREQIQAHSVDLLLIAGDVFDSQNPPASAQKMYYQFLRDVTAENNKLQIIIIAGNHDSAARLEAANPLLETMNVTVKGLVSKSMDGKIDFDNLIVPLRDGDVCIAVPYLRQGDYPSAKTYGEGVTLMYKMLIEKAQAMNASSIVCMGHLHANGAVVSENDRNERVMIGGLDYVSPEVFKTSVDYTAFGHLHRAQMISGDETIRYSGTPLPMSFAEINNKQGVVLVTIEASTTVERLIFDAPVKLLSIPKKAALLPEVLAEIAMLPNGEVDENAPFIEIRVLITEPEPSLRRQIEEALVGKAVRLARLIAETNAPREKQQRIITYEELEKMNPLEMATEVFKRKYGGDEMPEIMKEMLYNVIKEVE